jgi:hypothetical protein
MIKSDYLLHRKFFFNKILSLLFESDNIKHLAFLDLNCFKLLIDIKEILLVKCLYEPAEGIDVQSVQQVPGLVRVE